MKSSWLGLIFLLVNTPTFSPFIQHFGYIGIFIWFITFDQLTPLPEEISLLVIGYLSAHHVFNPVLAGIFSIAGFLTIDIAYYFLAKGGSKLLENKVKKPKSRFINSFKDKLRDNMPKTLLILCFIPRMRLWAPIMIGSMKLPFKKFLLFDVIGLSLFTTVYLSLGVVYHASVSTAIGKINGYQHIIVLAAVVIMTMIIFLIARKVITGRKDKVVANDA